MYTNQKNDEVMKKLLLSNKIFADAEERKYKFTEIKKAPVMEEMQKFKSEANIINYQLKRVVCDQDSHHVLAPKRTERIEVIPNTYMFFKVNTKDMLAPGKINFSYGAGQYVRARRQSTMRSGGPTTTEPVSPSSPTKPKATRALKHVELKAYFSVSDKNKEPTEENYDKFVDNPCGTITLPIMGKDRFDNEEVYISLKSIAGCEVHLTTTFPDLKI